jgi:hypothetical protein
MDGPAGLLGARVMAHSFPDVREFQPSLPRLAALGDEQPGEDAAVW